MTCWAIMRCPIPESKYITPELRAKLYNGGYFTLRVPAESFDGLYIAIWPYEKIGYRVWQIHDDNKAAHPTQPMEKPTMCTPITRAVVTVPSQADTYASPRPPSPQYELRGPDPSPHLAFKHSYRILNRSDVVPAQPNEQLDRDGRFYEGVAVVVCLLGDNPEILKILAETALAELKRGAVYHRLIGRLEV